MSDYVCPDCGMKEYTSLKWLPIPTDLSRNVYFLQCDNCGAKSNIQGGFISVVLESEWTEENYIKRKKMKNTLRKFKDERWK